LDIGISVGPMFFVKILFGSNKGNQIILLYATWEMLIAKRVDIEKFMQSTASASLSF